MSLLLALLLSQATNAPGVAVQDEGASIGWGLVLNCVGDGVACSYSGGVVTITVDGGGGGGYATIQEEGAPLAAQTTMNFVGPAVTAVDNGGSSRTDITVVAAGVGACGANQWASTLNNGAAPTCTQPGFSNLSGSASIAQGGTTETASAEDALLVGSGVADWQSKVLPSCSGATNALAYDSAANAFSCNTIAGGSGYATVQDEGSALTARATLNFTGAGVSCVDNGGSSRTDCTISGGGGGTSPLILSFGGF